MLQYYSIEVEQEVDVLERRKSDPGALPELALFSRRWKLGSGVVGNR